MKRLALIVAVVAVACAAAAPAYGQSAVGDAYGGLGGEVLGGMPPSGGNSGGEGAGALAGAGASAPAPAHVQVASAESTGSLPFTGLDLALLAIGGVVLIGVGVGVRRFARPVS